MAFQTPVQKAGYKVGDKFIVLEGASTFREGSEVTLCEDDGSNNPLFTGDQTRYNLGPNDTPGAFITLSYVTPLSKELQSIEAVRDRLLAIKEERVALDLEDKALREKLTEEGLALLETVVPVRHPVALPRSEWEAGDLLRCVGLDVDGGCASLTIGKVYTIRGDGHCITDDDGDAMAGCMDRGCFVWVSRP